MADKEELEDSVALRKRLKTLTKDIRFLIDNKLA